MWGCTSSLQETEHMLTPCSCLELPRNASIYTPWDWGLGKSYCYRHKPLHTLVLSTHKWVVGGQTIKGCMYLGSPALRHCKLVLLHFSYNSALCTDCCSHNFKVCLLRLNWSLAPLPLYLFKITYCVGKISFPDSLHVWAGTFNLPQRDNALNPCSCLVSAKSAIFIPSTFRDWVNPAPSGPAEILIRKQVEGWTSEEWGKVKQVQIRTRYFY